MPLISRALVGRLAEQPQPCYMPHAEVSHVPYLQGMFPHVLTTCHRACGKHAYRGTYTHTNRLHMCAQGPVTCRHPARTQKCRNTQTNIHTQNTNVCTRMHTRAHSHRQLLVASRPRSLKVPHAHSKSQKPAQQGSTHVGIRGQQWGRGAQFRGSHGVSPGPQAAGSPGQQAQPCAERRQRGHSPSQQGHHRGCRENMTGESRDFTPPTPSPTLRASPVGVAGSGEPRQGTPGAGGRAAAVSC